MGIDIDMESTSENGITTTGGGADDGGVHRRGNVENGDRDTVSYLSKLAAVDIEFNDLTYTLPGLGRDSNIILRGISGQFKSGELTAILGPSGAGKSTLLNILAGYKTTHIGGTININDQPRDIQKFRKMSCYIMQDDLVQSKLTVFEAMSFAADLKLGKRKSQSEKRIVINNILSVLRLSTKQETITEKLSGGERKRLVIALELVDNPPVIFLDEPTTGLDELSSSICVNVLQRLAHFGRTVICSVHTPSASIFHKFDHVYVLSIGQCTYRGTASNLVPFLKSINLECPKYHNPADFVIEISSGDYGLDQLERMIASVDTKLPISPISRTVHAFELEQNNPKVSWSDQFSTLVRRMLLQLYRNRKYIYLKASLQIFLGLIIGTLFWNMGNDGSKVLFNFGFCFACLIVFLYIPMLPILLHFPMEISIMKREYFNRWYTLNAYYWALTLINIPQQLLLGLTYLPIVYVSTGQPLEWDRCLMFFGTCFLCSFIAESIGYSIASTLNVVNSIFVGPALCCPLILLAIQNFGSSNDLPMYRTIFMYTSYIRYGLEALVLSMYGYNRKTLPCPLEEVYCHFNSPKEVFRSILGCKTMPNFWINISSLIIILLICKGTLYYLLRQRLKPNRTFKMLRLVRRIVKNHLNI